MRLVKNPFAHRGPYRSEEAEIVSLAHARQALVEVSKWPGYAQTALRSLDKVASSFGVRNVFYKDESDRLGQGSFKILGGAYAATLRLRELAEGSRPTLCCATDGNHGRSVAFAARKHECDCVVFMHENAPPIKAAAIMALGARVVHVPGNYDDSVRMASAAASKEGWLLIPDTSSDRSDPTTRHVMQGYGIMILEILDQLPKNELPTHVFVQSGVGGLAAGVAGPLAEAFGADRPIVVIVEPETAACLFESVMQGAPSRAPGDLITAMAMLSTGEASPVAWPILRERADVFMTISDAQCLSAWDDLCSADPNGVALDVGVSGAAGYGGLSELVARRDFAAHLGLGPSSNVLLFGTEGMG
jgi:diaminopropionate ammonia-lyase